MTQKNKRSRNIIVTIVSILVVVSVAALSLALLKHYNDSFVETRPTIIGGRTDVDETQPEGEWVVEPDEPRYMSIDKLGITNARIIGLGIKAGTENQLDDPSNIHMVGWYNKSTKPGFGTGSQAGLYDGHNTGYYENGVFANLGRLAIGDIIQVERGDGQVFNYETRLVQTLSLEEVNTYMSEMQKSVIEGIEGLNIITCGGAWDEANQTYTHRVIVRAVLSI